MSISIDENYKNNLYKIGLFSQMNKVTIKALHHYDDIGLLKPAFIDKFTGYRYYSSDQMQILHEIIALRQMGLSLDEILQVQKGASIEGLLLKKKAQILQKISEETMKLSQIEYYIHNRDEVLDCNVVLKSLPEVIVASMRLKIDSYDELFKVVPPMGKEMNRLGCICASPAYCFNIYHDGEYKEHDIDVEVCEAVVEKKQDSEMIKFKVIPKVENAACILHKGPYNKFPLSYTALIKWIEENGFKIIGPPRESYIDGIWNKDSDEEWLTEIQMPIEIR